ncbi:hypothetical protein L7F22_065559 [Adiantum nelumboides]|nr:hypothetical protein [Adiantum nelumboides]
MGSHGLALLLVLLWCFCFPGTRDGPGSLAMAATSAEIDALLDLKKGFNDPVQLANWDVQGRPPRMPGRPLPAPCSGWTGIACDKETLSVVSITLPACFQKGFLSASIGRLPHLQVLDLSGNALTGSLPVEITALRRLVRLDLHNNLLSNQLPADWSNMERLEVINLWKNQLNGSIPGGVFKATKVQRLRLENNNLSGEIPGEVGMHTKLRFFAVSFNLIEGSIPAELGNVKSLRSVYAAFNRFNGTLPESIGGLTRLVRLDLQHNKLRGVIPAAWSKLNSTLLTLNLSNNLLTGEVPAALSQRFNETSFMNNTDLCGAPFARMCSPSSSMPLTPSLPNNEGPPLQSRPRRGHNYHKSKALAGVIGGGVGAIAVFFLFLLVFLYRKSHAHSRGVVEEQNWFNADIQADRRHAKFELYDEALSKFSFQDIESHAGFLDTAHVAGRGRFATVYRSHFPDGTELALKMFKDPIVTATFEKEIPMLAAVKHKYLLPIKGYYSTSIEKAIFYDFYPRGTLYRLLHGYDASSPSIHAKAVDPMLLPDWATRQRIAFGVAQALDFLHRGCGTRILHMDVKSSNILLEASSLLPRLADYGLILLVSNKGPDSSDNVVETEGYTAPEVLVSRKHSDKSDIYSFGVVLLELITGKTPMCQVEDRRLALSTWAEELQQERRGREIMDAVALKTSPFPEYLDRALNLALLCVNENPSVRPAMSEVASILEGLASNPSPLRSPDQKMVNPLLLGR